MSLDTLPVAVNHVTVKNYLDKLDERGEIYSFVVTNENVGKNTRPLVLTLNRDGTDDALELRLLSDGTWSATHVIVVGETS
jgi:hypothetical protein